MSKHKELLAFMQQRSMCAAEVGNQPGYNPHCDISHLGAIALDEMWEDLTIEDTPPIVKTFMEKFDISKRELIDGYNKFVLAQKYITGEGRSETVTDGLVRAEFDKVRDEIRWLVEILFGRAMLAAFWYAVRDKCIPGEPVSKFIGYDTIDNLLKISCRDKDVE